MSHAHGLGPLAWRDVTPRAKSIARDPHRGYVEHPTTKGVGAWGQPRVSEAQLMDLTSFLRAGPRAYRDIARAFPMLYEEQIRRALRAVGAKRTGNTSRARYSL